MPRAPWGQNPQEIGSQRLRVLLESLRPQGWPSQDPPQTSLPSSNRLHSGRLHSGRLHSDLPLEVTRQGQLSTPRAPWGQNPQEIESLRYRVRPESLPLEG